MWGSMVGMGLGALAGATSSAGYKGKEFDPMVGKDDRQKYAQGGMSRLEGWASGKQPLAKQANINRLLSGQNKRLDAAGASARARASERAIQRGEGPRSGMLDKRLAEIDRDLIGAKREQAGPLMGQLAMQEPQYRMQAMSQMLPFLQGQEALAFQDHSRMEDLRAGRAAQGSALHRALAGAAGASGGLSKFGGRGAGGGYDWMASG